MYREKTKINQLFFLLNYNCVFHFFYIYRECVLSFSKAEWIVPVSSLKIQRTQLFRSHNNDSVINNF